MRCKELNCMACCLTNPSPEDKEKMCNQIVNEIQEDMGKKIIKQFEEEVKAGEDLMISFSELIRILDSISRNSIIKRTRNATDFAVKFKEQLQQLRSISKLMSMSMEQASNLMANKS